MMIDGALLLVLIFFGMLIMILIGAIYIASLDRQNTQHEIDLCITLLAKNITNDVCKEVLK